MDSDADPSKRGVAPFGYLGIKACSRLPQDFRSVPRPSSPSSAKASTRCPSLAQSQPGRSHQSPARSRNCKPIPAHCKLTKPRTGPIQQVSETYRTDPNNSHTHTITPPKNLSAWPGITWTTHRTPPSQRTTYLTIDAWHLASDPESSRTPQRTQQNLIHNYQRTYQSAVVSRQFAEQTAGLHHADTTIVFRLRSDLAIARPDINRSTLLQTVS